MAVLHKLFLSPYIILDILEITVYNVLGYEIVLLFEILMKGRIIMNSTDNANPKENACVCLRVGDITRLLGISHASAYNLVKKAAETQQPFRVIVVLGTYLVLKDSFYEFLYGQKGA